MSGFNVTIPKDTIKINDNSLEFEIKGDPKYGLDKTVMKYCVMSICFYINPLRRFIRKNKDH